LVRLAGRPHRSGRRRPIHWTDEKRENQLAASAKSIIIVAAASNKSSF
jgi:hypothetical protein